MKRGSICRVFVALALVAVLLGQTGCLLVAKDVVKEYHTLIEAYQAGQEAAANGNTCLALAFSEMSNQVVLANNYLVADVAKTEKYRQSLAEYGTKFNEQAKAYEDAGGQPSKLDLDELAKKGATPADMALTLNVYATTFYEAPLAQVNVEPVINAQRIVSEKYNMAFACVKDWNEAVRSYNTERNKIPGDVVGRLAEYLKVKELPQALPYFVMQAPAQPPTVPTVTIR